MNPLFSLFILAIFIEDYIFREGKFWKMYLYAIGIYTLFYTFQHRSTFHSPTKKFNMAGYNQSFDPTIYAKVKFDLTKAREFMAKKEKETGKKISVTLFWIKVVAEVFNNLPECNEIIRFGLKAKRSDVDLGVLVNVGDGKDLANMTMRNIPNRTFEDLSDELYREADIFKKEKNVEYNKSKSFLRILPTYVIEIALEISGILSTFGISIPMIGLKKNQFGSVIITSLGSLKLKDVYVPLCPFTQTAGVFACCSTYKKNIVNPDGSIVEKEYLPVNFSIDHRYVDGVLCAKMVREARRLFENPESFKVV